jgi:hypothetical protein
MSVVVVLDNADRKRLAQDRINAVPVEAGMAMEIKSYKSSRSLAQNRRYWAMIKDISEQGEPLMGHAYTSDIWHMHFRKTFLGMETIMTPGGELDRIISTTGLKTSEFNDYMMSVEAFAVELGVMLIDGNY